MQQPRGPLFILHQHELFLSAGLTANEWISRGEIWCHGHARGRPLGNKRKTSDRVRRI